jgi:hypothetical protein
MDIYDLIQDLQSFNSDMSEYPRVTSAWLSIHKYRYLSSDPQWRDSDIETERVDKIRTYMQERVRTQGLNFKPRYGADNNKARRCQCIQTGKVYDTLIECAKDNNVSVVTVRNWCKKEAKTTTNGQWNGLSFRYVD